MAKLNASRDSSIERSLRDTLERNYSDSSFGLPGMTEQLSLGERQLQRRLKDATGKSPAAYLRSFRLEKSKTLLKRGASVGDTARRVGFSSQSYFAYCFKEEYGLRPSELAGRSEFS